MNYFYVGNIWKKNVGQVRNNLLNNAAPSDINIFLAGGIIDIRC
jgi:hypothetical protein